MFLATTALSDFWDKDQPLFFLGSWCLSYERRAEWAGLKYQVMSCPWDDRERFYQAAQYLDEYHERMFDYLSDYLNAVHQVSYGKRYWRILIGVWLYHYLSIAYDRYVHLVEGFAKFPKLQTILLDSSSFRTPRDTIDTVLSASDDLYNLQIFSQLLQEMGYVFPVQPIRNDWLESGKGITKGEYYSPEKGFLETTLYDLIKGGGYRFAKKTVRRALNLLEIAGRYAVMRKRLVGLCDIYCSESSIRSLVWRTGFRFFQLNERMEWPFDIPESTMEKYRNGFSDLPSSSEFERIFVKTLSLNFPILYLESFQQAKNLVLQGLTRIPSVIVSESGWFYNEPFKFLAAEAGEQACRLVVVQHGGGYGIFRFSPPEQHEMRFADSFMAWGWAEKEPCRNLPSPKLSEVSIDQYKQLDVKKTEKILFVATEHPRYLNRFYSTPVGSQWEDYFSWELRFLAALPERHFSAVSFRPYHKDLGHGIRERISEEFVTISWDDNQSFNQSLRQCRLVVIDNCATTFLETLAANIPTILFWNPQRWEVRKEAELYFESLRKERILWDSPEEAAAKVVEIYDEPWAWWRSDEVQRVRRMFVNRFALSRENWADYWIKALKEEMEKCPF